MRLFAVAAPGLEPVVAGELQALGLGAGAVTVPGGVELDGDLTTLYRTNVWLRAASRVLVRLGEVKARDFARLRKAAAALPWETVAGPGTALDFTVTARRCRLFHTGAIAERLAGAALDRLGAAGGAGEPPLTAARLGLTRRLHSAASQRARRDLAPDAGRPASPQRIVVRGEDDVFTVSADASGELLHRRGYRTDVTDAPLRETLAAGVLLLAGYVPGMPLVDPTCGSGTFVIEAGLISAGRPPGERRAFAFERWPGYRRDLHQAQLVPVAGRPATLLGGDLDAAAVEVARRNAARAAVEAAFVQEDAARLSLPEGPPGLIVSNPPYGRRLDGDRALYRALRALVRPGWRLALLTPDGQAARKIGQPEREIALSNGGLRVGLYLF